MLASSKSQTIPSTGSWYRKSTRPQLARQTFFRYEATGQYISNDDWRCWVLAQIDNTPNSPVPSYLRNINMLGRCTGRHRNPAMQRCLTNKLGSYEHDFKLYNPATAQPTYVATESRPKQNSQQPGLEPHGLINCAVWELQEPALRSHTCC